MSYHRLMERFHHRLVKITRIPPPGGKGASRGFSILLGFAGKASHKIADGGCHAHHSNNFQGEKD
jgi:hypothetical protein